MFTWFRRIKIQLVLFRQKIRVSLKTTEKSFVDDAKQGCRYELPAVHGRYPVTTHYLLTSCAHQRIGIMYTDATIINAARCVKLSSVIILDARCTAKKADDFITASKLFSFFVIRYIGRTAIFKLQGYTELLIVPSDELKADYEVQHTVGITVGKRHAVPVWKTGFNEHLFSPGVLYSTKHPMSHGPNASATDDPRTKSSRLHFNSRPFFNRIDAAIQNQFPTAHSHMLNTSSEYFVTDSLVENWSGTATFWFAQQHHRTQAPRPAYVVHPF
ncbi:hypothetical protein CLF_112241 [Clonorchis sinensis]|uniref:Uncharacterized protein n=1 Tax=Clonorchis sinensis TaxID=79923 RepID=G7YW17_CLOSI|nr:hypothetical protein CLF_112241 [Clonorchis sinensis]